VFKRIREHFGVDRLQYMLSVAGNYNFLDFITNAKSGQFFFYSHDERFMIKVQHHKRQHIVETSFTVVA
jgi:1-phosphatidylinositol-4-phosphate 5-kinase